MTIRTQIGEFMNLIPWDVIIVMVGVSLIIGAIAVGIVCFLKRRKRLANHENPKKNV
jgi:ABC-type antimicrobial peptide transport system permease subunit